MKIGHNRKSDRWKERGGHCGVAKSDSKISSTDGSRHNKIKFISRDRDSYCATWPLASI